MIVPSATGSRGRTAVTPLAAIHAFALFFVLALPFAQDGDRVLVNSTDTSSFLRPGRSALIVSSLFFWNTSTSGAHIPVAVSLHGGDAQRRPRPKSANIRSTSSANRCNAVNGLPLLVDVLGSVQRCDSVSESVFQPYTTLLFLNAVDGRIERLRGIVRATSPSRSKRSWKVPGRCYGSMRSTIRAPAFDISSSARSASPGRTSIPVMAFDRMWTCRPACSASSAVAFTQ